MGPRHVLLSLLILSVLVCAGTALAAPAATGQPANVVTGLEVFQEDNLTRLVIRGQRTPTFTVFKLKNPDRLVVDLIGCDLKGVDSPRDVDNAHIDRIGTTQFKQAGSVVSRFIIGLKAGVLFNARAEGNTVIVTVAPRETMQRLSRPEPKLRSEPQPEAPDRVARAPEPSPARPATSKDHRVVLSQGNKQSPGKIRIKRIVNADDDSISILANRKPQTFEVLEVFDPFRIVLDVYGASMKTKRHERKLNGKHATRMRAVRHGDKVRVVLDCAEGKHQPYTIVKTRHGLKIRFGEPPDPKVAKVAGPPKAEPKEAPKVAEAKQARPPEAEPKPAEPQEKPKPASLRDVSFKHESGEARVVLDVEGEASPKVVHADQRSTVLEIANCKMPLILERTLDTSEFGSEVQSLSAYRVQGEDKVKLVAVTRNRVPSRLERREGKLHWVFESGGGEQARAPVAAPVEKQGGAAYIYAPDQVAGYSVRQPELAAGSGSGAKRGRYRGKRISLDFKDADIHNILRLISEVAKMNIITSDEVKGRITITMRNVPWDQALDIILKTKKLGKVRHGNIVRVATLDELSKEREMLQKAAEANRQLEPLRVRLVAVNYAAANDILAQVKDVLSDRGNVTVDQRTNVLIIKDVLENLIKAEGLIRSLDTETPQVLIEARIVEANTQFVRDVGIQWGGDLNFTAATGNPTGIPFPSDISMAGGADDTTTNNPLSGTASPGHFAVNLPAAVGAGSGGALGFIFGSAGGTAQLNLRLSALENRGAVKIVSAPKIATLDNHKAKIGQGVSIPISVVSAAGVNTQFVEAKLELEVTPHITQEGSVLMTIKVMKNEPDFSRTGARGDPTILKKEAETQVMVKDGDTTVIGGIYTKKTSDTVTGVPVLSKIPVLGWFFRSTKKNDDRTELLIFITPRVVNRLQATVSQK